MYSIPQNFSPLRLPCGEIVFYPTGRPSIRVLIQKIAALGYEVSGFPIQQTDRHCAVVLGEIILFIVAPAATSTSDSSSFNSFSNQSDYVSSEEHDSDNVDPEDGYWRR